MVTALLLLVALTVVVSLGWGVLRRERADETERFHRAREITSSWAAPGPRFQTVPAQGPDEQWTAERERDDRGD